MILKNVWHPVFIVIILTLLSSCILHELDPIYDDNCIDCQDYTPTPTPLVIFSPTITPADPLIPTSTPDQNDAGDTTNDAIEILTGESENHAISPRGDIDYFFIFLNADTQYRVALTDIEGFEPQLTVYDTNPAFIIEAKSTGTYTDTYDWWGFDYQRNYNPYEKEAIIFTPSEAGYYFISVKDMYNAHSEGSYTITVDNYSPSDSQLTLHSVIDYSSQSIVLSWNSLERPGLTGSYAVYRTDLTQDIETPVYDEFTLLSTINIQDNSLETISYHDETASRNISYYYFVKAIDAFNQHTTSNAVSEILDINAPPVEGFGVEPNPEYFQIDLTWDAVTVNNDGYYIMRTDQTQDLANPTYEDFQVIATLTDNSETSYSDDTIQPNTDYYYYIQSYNEFESGPASDVVTTEFVWETFRPLNSIIRASEGYSGRIRIIFENRYYNPGIIRYEVYRSATEDTADIEEAPVAVFADTDNIGAYVDDTDIDYSNPLIQVESQGITGYRYYYFVKVIFDFNGTEIDSQYSWFDSGIAVAP